MTELHLLNYLRVFQASLSTMKMESAIEVHSRTYKIICDIIGIKAWQMPYWCFAVYSDTLSQLNIFFMNWYLFELWRNLSIVIRDYGRESLLNV